MRRHRKSCPGVIGTGAGVTLGCSRSATPFGDRFLPAQSTANRSQRSLSTSCGYILKHAIDLKILAASGVIAGRVDRPGLRT
jgi:hypothetical protein